MFSYFNHVTKTEHQRGKATGPQSQSTSARIYLFNFWVIFIHYLVFAFQALFDLKFLLQYSWLTMLCYFQVYSTVIQFYLSIHVFV